ncbi:MAG TPA: hypothetical protein VI391_01645 [Thermoanaerobaculia bacterium]
MTTHYRTIAGNLWFFIAVYLVDFGLLGLIFFWRTVDSRNGRYGSAAAIVAGLLLLTRAKRMLDWHRAIFWIITLLAIAVPIGLLIHPLLRWR